MVLQLFSRQRQTLQSEIDFILGNIIKLARPCFFLSNTINVSFTLRQIRINGNLNPLGIQC